MRQLYKRSTDEVKGTDEFLLFITRFVSGWNKKADFSNPKQKGGDTVPTRHHPRTPPRSTKTTRTHGARRSIPLGATSGRDQSLLRRRSMAIILLTRLDCVEEFQLEHLAVKMVVEIRLPAV